MKVIYGDMTWPEVKEAADKGKVPLIPVGSTEQHGPHLPTKTDAFLAYEICRSAAELVPEEALVMPSVNYGYNEHHLDFPATIHIDHETLIRFVIDIGKSLAHHGFRKIVIVNEHGSNTAPMEIAGRRITLETNSLCASVMCESLAPEAYKLLEAEEAHGGDFETSEMLYLAPKLVDMRKAVRDWNLPQSRFIRYGVEPGDTSFAVTGGGVQFMDWWSRMSKTGILGDPTKASAEKGKRVLDIYAKKLSEFVQEFRRRQIVTRKDYH